MKKVVFFIIMNMMFWSEGANGQESLLPIYSNPMVFIDSTGKVVGTLPADYKILNTGDGKHDGGYAMGLAGNTVSANFLIPAKDFKTGKISFFDKSGKFKLSYGDFFESISPNINGFHLATHVDNKGMIPKTSYIFLNADGSRVFEYNGYYKADRFSEGMAAVHHRGWHYIDYMGNKYNLIDSSLTNIVDVSSFYNGVSKIKIWKGNYLGGEHFRFIFIDKKGNKLIDTEDIFPNEHIGIMGNMRDSISRIIFLDNKGYNLWGQTAYLKLNGEVLSRFDSLFRIQEFSGGYVPVLIQTKTAQKIKNAEGFIFTKNGEKIGFGKDKDVLELIRIDGQFYWVYLKDKNDNSNFSGIYDVMKREFIYQNKHDIMGMKWDLISFRDSKSNRYYVVNYKTGEIVFDTDKSELVFTDINEALAFKNEVRKFVCSKSEDVVRLGELQNLKELTLRNMDIVELPKNFQFAHLEKLKIDGLRNLKKLPDHIKDLKKLSLRNCPNVDNLMEMLTGLNGLEELFIINFDVTPEEKKKISENYKSAKLTIKGKKEYSDSELQEVIFGF
jgi:hypothetical protein